MKLKSQFLNNTTTKPLNQNNMKRLFDIYFGWFFVNGRKQEAWYNYLNEKYGNRFDRQYIG
jgi:hypothetical protein